MLVICKKCSVEFDKSSSEIKVTPNHFCSKSCSAKYNNVGRQRNPPKERACKKCNGKYVCLGGHKSLSLCESCSDEHKNKSNSCKELTLLECQSALYLKDKHPSWINGRVRSFARSWNKDLTEMPCQKCGYSTHVELCHIKAVSKFDSTSKLEQINHPDNLLVLCRNHHWEFDNGILPIDEIPKRT